MRTHAAPETEVQRVVVPSTPARTRRSERDIDTPRSHSLARLSLILALACGLPGTGQSAETPLDAAPDELVTLMDHFAKSGVVRADFAETRRLSLLTEAIETRGVLYFAPPNRLARHTTLPGDSRVSVYGGRVAFRDETGTRRLDLGSSEVARSLVGNLMVVLRGDLPELRARYEIRFASNGQDWQLDLEPRPKAVRAMIEMIRFSGTGWMLRAVETRETNGDVSIVTLSRVETRLTLSVEDFSRIFSLDIANDDGPMTSSPQDLPNSVRAPVDP